MRSHVDYEQYERVTVSLENTQLDLKRQKSSFFFYLAHVSLVKGHKYGSFSEDLKLLHSVCIAVMVKHNNPFTRRALSRLKKKKERNKQKNS